MRGIDASAVADLFLPPRCPYCGTVIRHGARTCPGCASIAPRPAVRWIPMGQQEMVPCVTAYPYEMPVRGALQRFKFEEEPWLGAFYGEALAGVVAQTDLAFDLLTWVPLSRMQRLHRGYNQSELLAKAAAGKLGKPYRPMLRKCRHNKRQHFLPAAERWKNVEGVFAARPGAGVVGHAVLLIDDIVTTGATLHACAQALLEAGAHSVCCAAVATPPGACPTDKD